MVVLVEAAELLVDLHAVGLAQHLALSDLGPAAQRGDGDLLLRFVLAESQGYIFLY